VGRIEAHVEEQRQRARGCEAPELLNRQEITAHAGSAFHGAGARSRHDQPISQTPYAARKELPIAPLVSAQTGHRGGDGSLSSCKSKAKILSIRTLNGLLCAAGLAGGLAGVTAAHAESLADAIALAYKTNPTLQGQRAQLRVTDEAYVQARAGYRPQVNVQIDATRQDYVQQTTNSGTAFITAQQPLYTGGRTATAVNAAEADVLSGRETLRGTEASVMAQVITAYADVIRDQEGLKIQQDNLTALQGILDETSARTKVGDLTRSDEAQTQGYVSQAKVQLATAKAQLEVSRSNYAAVVGERPGTLDPLPPLPGVPATLDQALTTAEEGNPSLRSSEYAEQAARLRTAEARDQRLPNITLRMQYGYSGPESQFTPQIYPKDFAATVSLTQPLFAGGVIDSQIRQQIQRQAAARMQTENSRRTMVQEIGQAWSEYLANHENQTNADQGVKQNQVAYDGMRKERQADLRSTLEVLYIEQSLAQSELTRAAAYHDAYVAQANLLSTMGLLEASLLTPDGVEVYDPAKNFNRVKMTGMVPWEFLPDALDHVTSPGLQHLPPPPKAPAPAPATPAQ
jgi:outer membrane protein